MKKLLLILGLIIILTACGSNEAPAEEPKKEETKTEKVEEKAEVKKEVKEEPKEEEKEAPVLIEEIPYNISMLEPDSIGNIYAEATYTNNSNHILSTYEMEILLKNSNEKVYLNNYDTVRPNETSPNFQTNGPNTGLVDDMEVLKISYVATRGDKSHLVEYNVKTNTYSTMEWTDFSTEIEPPVLIDELPYQININEPDSSGTVYGTMTYTNNSNKAISSFSVTILLKDKNEKTYYSSYDTVLEGETSPNIQSFGPSTGLDEDLEALEIEYTVMDKNNKRYHVSHDIKANKYTVLELVD